MTTKKISELAAAAALLGTEQVPVVQSGTTVRTTTALLTALPRAIATITGLQAALDAKVGLAGNETIAGIKTLSSAPVVPDGSFTPAKVAGLVAALLRLCGTDVGAPGGTDDTALVVAARTAAGVGGRLVFGPGTYVVDGLAASVADQHWIVPPGTILKTKNNVNTPTINVTAAGVTIDGGGTIDGNRANQTLTGLLDSTGGPTAGVRVVAGNNCTVSGLRIQNCGTQGVYVSNSTGFALRHCRITNSGPAGNSKAVLLYDYYGNVSDAEIAGNTIDCTASTNGCIAVAMYSTVATDIRIHHNRLLVGDANASSTLGIELFTSELSPGTGGSIRDLTIDHNVIRGPSTAISTDQIYGISVGGVAPDPADGDANITITGNVIRNCPSHSIEIIGTSVAATGNTITSSGPIAVYANEVAGGIYGVAIVGNTIINSALAGYAVLIEGSTNGVFGLVIADNTIRNPVGQCFATSGVVSGMVIRGNTLTAGKGVAVLLQGTVTDSLIEGNVFDLTGVSANTDAIMLASTTLARLGINDNTIKGASRHGIYGLNACSDVSIVANRITNCGGSGVYGAAAMTRWTLYSNTVANNTDWGIAFAVAAVNLAIASNSSHDNPAGNYYTTGSTFYTHVINGAGG